MAEYEGKFEWEYLEQGPEIWKVSIGKKWYNKRECNNSLLFMFINVI
jgi:uncharacterized protein (DUF2249 family)